MKAKKKNRLSPKKTYKAAAKWTVDDWKAKFPIIKDILIGECQDTYQFRDCATTNGHCHTDGGVICVASDCYKPETVFHELAHLMSPPHHVGNGWVNHHYAFYCTLEYLLSVNMPGWTIERRAPTPLVKLDD